MQDAGEEMELFATSASSYEDAAAKGEDMELLTTDAQKHVSLRKYFVPAKDLTDPLPTKKQMKKFMKQADQGAKKAIKIMRRRRSYGDARDQWVDAAGHLHMGPGRRRVGSGMAKTKWVPPAYNAPPPGPSPYARGSGDLPAPTVATGSAAVAVLTQVYNSKWNRKFKMGNHLQGAVFKESQEVDAIVSEEPVMEDEFVEARTNIDDVVEESLLSDGVTV